MTFPPKFDDGSRLYQPSGTLKVNERRVSGLDADPTVNDVDTMGIDVSRHTVVLFSVSAVTPAPALHPTGWSVEVVVWRLKREVNGRIYPAGQWYATEVDQFTLDAANIIAGRPQERAYPTLNSEKMFFELRSMTVSEGVVPVSWELNLVVTQLGRRTDETQDACCPAFGASASASASIDEAIHDDPVIATGIHPMMEAKNFDGVVLPNDVDEGDAVRAAATLHGVGYTMPVTESGADSAIVPHDTAISAAAGGSAVIMAGAEAKVIDGGVLPNAVSEGDATRVATSRAGVLYGSTVTPDGESTAVIEHDAAIGVAGNGLDGTVVAGVEAKNVDGAAFPNSVAEGDVERIAASLHGVLYNTPAVPSGTATAIVPDATAPSVAAGGLANIMIGAVARAVQVAAVAAGSAVSLVTNTFRELVIAGFDWASSLIRTEEQDPIDTRDVPDSLADNTTVTESGAGATVDFYLDMAHLKFLSLYWAPSDGNFTLTVEASNEDNGTAPAGCLYFDVTSQWFGAASYIATAYLERTVPIICKWVHIKVVRAAGVGNGTHTLFARRSY